MTSESGSPEGQSILSTLAGSDKLQVEDAPSGIGAHCISQTAARQIAVTDCGDGGCCGGRIEVPGRTSETSTGRVPVGESVPLRFDPITKQRLEELAAGIGSRRFGALVRVAAQRLLADPDRVPEALN